MAGPELGRGLGPGDSTVLPGLRALVLILLGGARTWPLNCTELFHRKSVVSPEVVVRCKRDAFNNGYRPIRKTSIQ